MPITANADMAWRGMAKSPAASAPRPTSGQAYRAVLLRSADKQPAKP
ncbi:hypothetical protein [Streptomyces sp. NPDC058466]